MDARKAGWWNRRRKSGSYMLASLKSEDNKKYCYGKHISLWATDCALAKPDRINDAYVVLGS